LAFFFSFATVSPCSLVFDCTSKTGLPRRTSRLVGRRWSRTRELSSEDDHTEREGGDRRSGPTGTICMVDAMLLATVAYSLQHQQCIVNMDYSVR
jgi:hypothetical protein